MIDYRKLNMGDKLVWMVEESFDRIVLKHLVTVTDIDTERAIAVPDDDASMHLWIDDDTSEDFYKPEDIS